MFEKHEEMNDYAVETGIRLKELHITFMECGFTEAQAMELVKVFYETTLKG